MSRTRATFTFVNDALYFARTVLNPPQIRHGESTDNLVGSISVASALKPSRLQRAVWAGWADATLTNHGWL